MGYKLLIKNKQQSRHIWVQVSRFDQGMQEKKRKPLYKHMGGLERQGKNNSEDEARQKNGDGQYPSNVIKVYRKTQAYFAKFHTGLTFERSMSTLVVDLMELALRKWDSIAGCCCCYHLHYYWSGYDRHLNPITKERAK